MQSKLTRRAVLAGVPAVAVAAALPAIPALAGVEQDPVADLGRRWLSTRKRYFHWSRVEDHAAEGSPEKLVADRLCTAAHEEMLELEGAMEAIQATTVAGLLARWEVLEYLAGYIDSLDRSDHDLMAIAMRADLERLSGGAL